MQISTIIIKACSFLMTMNGREWVIIDMPVSHDGLVVVRNYTQEKERVRKKGRGSIYHA
jgi:hypothetical protein